MTTASNNKDPRWVRQAHPVVSAVAEVAEPLLRAEGYELVDTQYQTSPPVLVVYVDRPWQGAYADPAELQAAPRGITLDELSTVTRLLSDALDVADPVECAYRLEVSSPGLERPLSRRSDFERSLGLWVQLKTRDKIDGGRRFKGRLVEVRDEAVDLEIDNKRIAIPVYLLERAQLRFVPPRKATGRRQGRK